MIGSIIKIAIGFLLWKYVPRWITYGPAKTRSYIQLGCNILGLIIVISGVISLLHSLGI